MKHSAWEAYFCGLSCHQQNFEVASERNCDTCKKCIMKNGWSILKGGNIKQDLGYMLAKVRTFGMQMRIIALAKVATLQQGNRYISRI